MLIMFTFILMGIIPALAGNTFPLSATQGAEWDHPRSRGEYDWSH